MQQWRDHASPSVISELSMENAPWLIGAMLPEI
jgi:hypothetical protein